jgi:hypothetical protein
MPANRDMSLTANESSSMSLDLFEPFSADTIREIETGAARLYVMARIDHKPRLTDYRVLFFRCWLYRPKRGDILATFEPCMDDETQPKDKEHDHTPERKQ